MFEEFLDSSETDRGVSPVIAVVLMIGVTVVLGGAALAGGAQFLDGFGENPSAQITFDVDENGNVNALVNTVNDDVTSLETTVNGRPLQTTDWQYGNGLNATSGANDIIVSKNNGVALENGDRIVVTAYTNNNEAVVADFTYSTE